MNVVEYTSLINNPNAINDIQSITLEKIAQEFPYFQSARALYLKGLYNQNSFKYNYALKITAAHTTDRTVLFDFITSDSFVTIHKGLYDKKVAKLLDIPVNEIEIINDDSPKLEQRTNTVEESILISIKNAAPFIEQETVVVENKTVEKHEFRIPSEKDYVAIETIVAEKTEERITENLEIGKPLVFSKNEKHSFQEWLQLSKLKPIIRDEEIEIDYENTSELNFEKQKKNELIDKFIETNPKIPAIKHDSQVNTIVFEPSISNNSYLMTETLARVYLEQKKYQKAIQAYQILILKYPEKSSFFADRILDIKNLQQNNK
ncbi:tetratricopeptide repeat protein [Flavobacterium myungsuense]|uniref:Tetratricopeptide repeat protein n=1 Tax=Flavobacterium myungsuense TaxID=651823 RepID=A0ABW3J0P6_9FLAO